MTERTDPEAMPQANHAELVKHLREEAFDCDICSQAAEYLDLLRAYCLALREREEK